MCLVSIVIPMYNAEKYADALLRSLSSQTLQDIEVICVNDGSTDATENIIKKHMEIDARLKYIFQENAGAGVARNNGIASVQGEYFICFDADDEYDTNLLEELYKNANHHYADIVICLFRRVDHWNKTKVENLGFNYNVVTDRCFSHKELPTILSDITIGPINKMYRTEFIKNSDIRYCTTRVSNDNLFGMATLLAAKRILCISNNLLTVQRHINPDSITSKRANHLEDTVNVFIDFYNWLEKHNYGSKWIEIVSKRAISAFGYNTQYGATDKYYNAIRKLFQTGPWAKMSGLQLLELVPLNEESMMAQIKTAKSECHLDEMETSKKVMLLENKLQGLKKIVEIIFEVKGIEDEIFAENSGKVNKQKKQYKDISKSNDTSAKVEFENNKIKTSDIVVKKGKRNSKFIEFLKKFIPASKHNFFARTDEVIAIVNKNTSTVLYELASVRKEISKLANNIENIAQILEGKIECINHRLEQQKALQQQTEDTYTKLETVVGNASKAIADNHRLTLEIESTIKKDDQILEEIKTLSDAAVRWSSEAIWCNIFNNTILDSTWLTSKSFSPGRWAVGYPFLYFMYRILNDFKPSSVLELGLGQSTSMLVQYAKAYDFVEHSVVEHDEEWITLFQKNIEIPKNTRIIRLDREMATYKEAEEVRVFSDFKNTFYGSKFDFILIDAPLGGDMKQYSRIDILSILPFCLNESFVIILDDYQRKAERNTGKEIERILKENHIKFAANTHRGDKDLRIWTSVDNKFICTL